jgi:hypothetical protein
MGTVIWSLETSSDETNEASGFVLQNQSGGILAYKLE